LRSSSSSEQWLGINTKLTASLSQTLQRDCRRLSPWLIYFSLGSMTVASRTIPSVSNGSVKLSFKPQEIDHHVLKLTVGVIAVTLPILTACLSADLIQSISASYYEEGWARDFFVGFLFAISSFLFAYNGDSSHEMLLSKIAALAALGVALFPCGCGTHAEIVPYVHYISAAAMFIVLACLCGVFFYRARSKGHREARWRSCVYAGCGITIVIVITVLAIDHFAGEPIGSKAPRLIFYGESTGLVAFGISWLVASRTLPLITAPGERVSVLPISAS
jgi:hypothetical protein